MKRNTHKIRKRKEVATKNKTIVVLPTDVKKYKKQTHKFKGFLNIEDCVQKTFFQDFFEASYFFPKESVDLIILDPPDEYQNYRGSNFKEKKETAYKNWFEDIIIKLKYTLKSTGSIYVFSNWKTSIAIAPILQKHFIIQNRIVWEKDIGKSPDKNWKNTGHDIWFCTASKKYKFNKNAVRLKKKVKCRYTQESSDYITNTEEGIFKLCPPTNLWTDISPPFWAMEENTSHPNQKSEKLIAKLILASTTTNDIVLDPFLGSGTTSVVAKKLRRKYIGIEKSKELCILAEKRIEQVLYSSHIQGYIYKTFWEKEAQNKYKQST